MIRARGPCLGATPWRCQAKLLRSRASRMFRSSATSTSTTVLAADIRVQTCEHAASTAPCSSLEQQHQLSACFTPSPTAESAAAPSYTFHISSSAFAKASTTGPPSPASPPPPPLQELLRSPSSFYAPLTVTPIPGKGRGVLAAKDFAVGDMLLVSSPLALVEAVPSAPSAPPAPSSSAAAAAGEYVHYDYLPGNDDDDASAGSSSNSSSKGSSRASEGTSYNPQQQQPGAGDLVRLLTRSALSPRQAELLAALFTGDHRPHLSTAAGGDNTAMIPTKTSAARFPDDDDEGGQASGCRLSNGPCLNSRRQLAYLSPPPEGPIKALLLPNGEFLPQVVQQRQLHARQQLVADHARGPKDRLKQARSKGWRRHSPDDGKDFFGDCEAVAAASLRGAVIFNCYGDPRPADDLLVDALLISCSGWIQRMDQR